MTRVAIYRRVSTTSQVDGFSLDTQLEQLTALAQARGFTWEDFCDPGISGETLAQRPALTELLTRLDDFDAVLIVDESRLARDEYVAAIIRRELRQANVRLITPSGETDLSNPTDRFTSGLMSLVAQFDQDLRRAKMMTGLQAAAQRGYWTGGPAPVGYRIVTTEDGHSTLEINEEEAAMLRTAIDMIIDEGLTTYQVCKRFAALGYRTRTGTLWGHRNLWQKLVRRHLIGDIPYHSGNGEIPRHYPPLISEQRFNQLQQALTRTYKGPKAKHRTYPLSGRITCRCGQKQLVGVYRNDRDTRYYMCPRNTSSAVTGDKCPIHPRQQRAQNLEDIIWQAITQTLADPERLRHAAAQWASQHTPTGPDPTQERNTLQRRLAEIDSERLRTFRDAPRLGLTDTETQNLLTDLDNERETLTTQLDRFKQLDRLAQQAVDWPTHLDHLADTAQHRLQTLDPDTRAEILELLQIEVAPTDTGYTIQGTIPTQPQQPGNIPKEALQRR